jgi:hypothetical protein
MLRTTQALIVALLSLAAFALAVRAQAGGTPTPEPDHMHMETPEADHHDRANANGAAVKITSPGQGDRLNASTVIVRVETTNWPLGESGHHFHLYVNGQEQGMSQGASPALQASDLQPGENLLEVVLSNDLHQELNATDKITVHYEAGERAAEVSAVSAASGLSSGVLITLALVVAAVTAILAIGFALTRRKAE